MIVTDVVELDATVAHTHDTRHALGKRWVVSNHDDSGAVLTIDLKKQFVNRVTGRAV